MYGKRQEFELLILIEFFFQDWVKCRLNINYIDSNSIEISSYSVNHSESIPLKVNIKFDDLTAFEKVKEVDGVKPNVFALHWTQLNQTSEFYIAIDDPIQFKNYEIYLNNAVRISRMAVNGKKFIRIIFFRLHLLV